ncbi:hypothetical protein DL96DRAFT_1678057 [Flagelloscypha sp. PMI_526]|nr:hypothetical protein DL96DRAFT_1678057 [Flagelloscypha sp. PMI_526]
MRSTFVSTSLLVLASIANVAAFAINNPEIDECGKVTITWEDVQDGPYDLWVVDPKNPCDDPYVDLGADHQGTHITWDSATVPAGLQVQLSLQSQSGKEAWSDVITVKAGNSTACKIPDNLKKLAPKVVSSTSSVAASTLVVTPSVTAAAPTETSSDDTTDPLQAVGAASSSNAASARSHVSTPVVLFGTLLGAAFFAL